ncbi:MAG: RagB/SusD family nutrient uptake outer membrane protein [Dysgonamonadaceae bacterium]|jgi:hypothetical protein|nr:RagB/SusD family nutrient uptake outer membrane protein [Dysgonamonadaceae bacterium]
MKTIKIYFLFLAMIAALSSCEDMFGDFLNKQPSNELTEKEVFLLWSNTQKFHFDTYNFLRNGALRINKSWLDAATDLAHTSYSSGGVRNSFNIGNYYAAAGASELTATWEHYYRAVRKCNMLLENIDNVPKTPSDTEENYQVQKKYYKAESRFLRAYFFWELFLRYGAIPQVTKTLDPNGDLLTGYTERPANQVYLNYILNELTECEPNLMDKPTQDDLIGRICKPMANALRSRILLYMASPRYNLVSWEEAAKEAKSFMDNFGSSYGLMSNYQDAILTPVHNGNNEAIFWRNDAQINWNDIADDTPVGEGGNGGLCPSQNLVDMYDMSNGQSPFSNYDETGSPVYSGNNIPNINSLSGYNETTPYLSRDSRFYATVIYHNSVWNNAEINVIKGGRDNPVGNANATPTGYYFRKYIPMSILSNNHSLTAYRNWIFIRYAEILLNYAEAMNEINGPSPEVFNTLQRLRDRAGLTAKLSERPDLQNKDNLRNFIRKERTVELAFEEHRAWDVRRWNVAEKALARPVYGMDVILNAANQPVYTRKIVQNRVFNEKMYLYPIPEAEAWKTNIQNNPGW